jgi:hypothetical protein
MSNLKIRSLFACLTACALMLLTSIVFGLDGAESGGGGDPCERRIKEIRDDIRAWINLGNSGLLVLPDSVNHTQYANTMTSLLAEGSVRIQCPSSVEDPEYTDIFVEGSPKTCRNTLPSKTHKALIECDYRRFNILSVDAQGQAEQYRLIHHEFAVIAGFEVNDGSSSDYKISDQITSDLKQIKTLKLVVDYSDEDQLLAWQDTAVATCKFTKGTGNIGWVHPTPDYDLIIYQTDPRSHPNWLRDRYPNANGILSPKLFKIIRVSGVSIDNRFFPSKGLWGGGHWAHTDGTFLTTLQSKQTNISGTIDFKVRRIEQLATRKKFSAVLFLIDEISGKFASATLKCNNIHN